jgi:N-acetylmuramoyl-L-alanine amidase
LNTTSSLRGRRWGTLLLLAVLPALPAHARPRHSETWARDRFAAAERMREALNGRPPADRTRRDYQRVINAYRNVYYGAPTSTKADPSVVAVAETMVEMGRRFDDDKILNKAITEYRFLRKEYPGSKYRCDALFTIGEIYSDDLNQPEEARATFEEFLHRYPRHRLAEDAQQAIAELDRQAKAQKSEPGNNLDKQTSENKDSSKASPEKEAPADAQNTGEPGGEHASEQHRTHLPRVTAIRHWSTPDYTRVAIDVESDVKFGSQRISHPDRIFFDLRDTRLASTLVGKSFDVDDGFLKKIRVAQFQPGRTRVVLEVDNLSDYDAFLLPNPYRIIIDIHGRGAKTARAKQLKNEIAEKSGANDVEFSPTDKGKLRPSETVSGKLLADAGKEPVASENVTTDAKIALSGEVVKPNRSPLAQANGETKEGVKKVIVGPDDDDTSPVEAANRDADIGHTDPSAARLADASAEDETSNAGAEKTAHLRSKSSTRLARHRRPADPDLSADSEDGGGKDDDAGMRERAREAKPTARGDRSLIRALGLKIGKIVIDPGHGGHDTGTIGPNGLEEKDLVLEVSRRLGKLLESRLGAEVVYTRKDDTFIPLETRTAIANQQRADLFISIHANSSSDPAARGVETYYLNFTSNPDALDVAARENAVSEKSIYELQDLVKKIALKEKIEESREFAGDVEASLHSGLAARSPAIRDRGVKKAPFIVLIGANMPSILAEISFVSNPTDERHLKTSEYRQRIAESLYRGIAKYVNGLSGVKLASKIDKTSGQ